MPDTKYIKSRHNKWYFQRRVPKALRHLYPDTEILELSLETGDLRLARERRDIILGQMRQQEQELDQVSPEKQNFLKYLAELQSTKSLGNLGSPSAPVSWEDVCDPYTQRKEDDPAYVEAYYAVLNNKSESPKYKLTLNELLQKFIRHSIQEDLHTSGTRDRYKKTVELYLAFNNVKDLQLEELSREKALDFISHYRSRVSGATVYAHISRLKTLLEYAYRQAWFKTSNPFDKHKINTTAGRKKKQPFTPDETRKLLEVVRNESANLRLLVWLGLYSGARISELVSIPLSALAEDDGLMMLGIATERQGKTEAATRHVPVPERCRDLLCQVKGQAESAKSHFLFSELVTPRPDGRLAYGVTKMFSSLKKKHITKRSDKGFHSFRVMMSTFLQRAAVSELVAAHLIGHSRKGLTMTYGYYSKGYTAKQLAEAQNMVVQEYDEYVGEIVNLT